MKFNELNVVSNKNKTRVGRGISAGKGKTAGRGTKGQKARAGSGKKEGFEGGQTPLVMRLPRLRGFTSHRAKTETVYTSQLNGLKGAVTNETLFAAGITKSAFSNVKVVLNGDVTAAVKVSLQGASASAKDAIQKAGGQFTKVELPKRTAKQKESK